MRFFEVKIKIERTLDTGEQKNVAETYAVSVQSFTEAEARVTAAVMHEATGDLAVTHEKIAQYDECVIPEDGGKDGRFYLVKYSIITVDDFGKRKKTARFTLFRDRDLDAARQSAHRHMAGSVTDYEIACIKETDILQVFTD